MGRYEEINETYEWDRAWDSIAGEKDGWVNLGHEVIGKHVEAGDGDRFAVRIVDFGAGEAKEFTYGELERCAGRFVNYLDDLGIKQSDRVAAMLEASPELYTTMFGCWLAGIEFVPLFILFGPDATNYRLGDADAKAIVTTSAHSDKVDLEGLEDLKHVILTDNGGEGGDRIRRFEEVDDRPPEYEVADTNAHDTAVIQYTSGTTGPPKGVELKHMMPVTMHSPFTYSADHRPEDNYFGAAPPAWSYGLFGCTAFALHAGMGTTSYRGEFRPGPFIDVLEEYDITNLFAPPTLLRQLSVMDIDFESVDHDLRIVVTAGEPLDPGTVEWVREAFDSKIVDHYGFTESGTMLVNNYVFDDWKIKPGSMGKPTPGFDVRVFDLEENEEVPRGEVGEIVFSTDTPLGAEGYLNKPKKSEEKWGGDWVRSDDLARVDEDGYFWFEGRADEVILSAGYRIGPTEVENALMEHEAVSEVAVVGLPDKERGEIVAAFVVPTGEHEGSDDLADRLRQSVKNGLSRHEYPREIHFTEELPKTASEKIQRFKLREEYSQE